MGTLHVCFADMPQYGTDAASATTASMHLCPKESNLSPSISPTPRYERNMGFFRQLSRRFGLRSNDDDLVYAGGDDDAHSSSTDSCSSSAVGAFAAAASAAAAEPMQSPSTASMTSSSSAALRSSGAAVAAVAREMHGSSMEHISCASESETSSTVDIEEQQQQQQHDEQEQLQSETANHIAKERKSLSRSSFSRLHRRSTTSIRRAFESFSLSSRSLSCSGATPPPPPATHGGSGGHTTPIKSALKYNSSTELDRRGTKTGSAKATATASSSSTSSLSIKSNKSKNKPPPQRILRQPVSYTYLKGISGLPTQRVPRNSVCCQYARR